MRVRICCENPLAPGARVGDEVDVDELTGMVLVQTDSAVDLTPPDPEPEPEPVPREGAGSPEAAVSPLPPETATRKPAAPRRARPAKRG